MPATEERVQVAFPLPRTGYERVERAARDGQRSLDDELAVLVESGLNAELPIRSDSTAWQRCTVRVWLAKAS